ncbi:hypothetical protein ACTMTI_24155 [Nonomuraea sp. H19]|uniref:hypothetical protein n=1 Tax=Nonomuraea sp. H19 TaxID=3452206 RepID=UPI003F8C7585
MERSCPEESVISALMAWAATGARAVDGTEVHLIEITADQVTDGNWSDPATSALLRESDAIVFGAPTCPQSSNLRESPLAYRRYTAAR